MLLQTLSKQIPEEHRARCEYIEDFYNLCDPAGNYSGLPKKEKLVAATLRIPTTKEDAEWITRIYTEVYRDTYPYTEMLTPAWIFQKFTDPNFIWGIFESDADAPTPGEVVGCFTIVLDREHKTGYFRGMMIRPKYQKLVAIRELSFAMFWNTIHATHPQINKYYCESRTAHNITQYLASVVGCNAHAILINKDQFLNTQESDALMVGYTRAALHVDRQPPDQIHLEVLPIYRYIKQIYQLPGKITFKLPKIRENRSEIAQLMAKCKMKITQEEFNYRKITLTLPTAHLTALYTPQIDAIEKIEYQVTSDTEFIVLCKCLQQLMAELDVKYCEWYVVAEKTTHTAILLQLGYRVLGYVPAWKRDRGEKFHDCVILAQTQELSSQQKDALHLLPQGHKLLEIIDNRLCEV